MLFGRRKDMAKKRPWRLSAKLLIASSVATVIGFSAVCASVMLEMRRGDGRSYRVSQVADTIRPLAPKADLRWFYSL